MAGWTWHHLDPGPFVILLLLLLLEKMVTMLTIMACKFSMCKNCCQVTLKVKKNVIVLQSLAIVVSFDNNEASREQRFSSSLVWESFLVRVWVFV
jgi:hypothetical protein